MQDSIEALHAGYGWVFDGTFAPPQPTTDWQDALKHLRSISECIQELRQFYADRPLFDPILNSTERFKVQELRRGEQIRQAALKAIHG